MAVDWDPTSGIVGLDWPVIRQLGARLDHKQRAVAAHVPSTAAETVTAIATYFDRVVGEPTYICEVADASDAVPTQTTATFAPNEDVAFSTTGGTWAGSPTNTVGNRHTNIDEATPSDTDYIEQSGAGSGLISMRCNTAAGFGTNPVVTKVEFKYRFSVPIAPSTSSVVTFEWNPNSTGLRELDRRTLGAVTSPYTTYTLTLETNPSTGAAWTEADIQAFDSVDQLVLRAASSGGSGSIRISYFAVVVHYYEDLRVASGSASVSADGWATFTLDSSWSKANSTNYLVSFRRTSDLGSAVVPLLDSDAAHPGSHSSYQPSLLSSGAIESLGSSKTAVLPITFTVGGSNGVDCQPYVRLRKENVDTNSTVKQEITTGGSGVTVGWVRLTAASARVASVPGAALLAKIKNGAGTQQGGTATFGTERVEDAPATIRALDQTLASTASLSAATQYHIELTSTAADAEGWVVSVLDSLTPPVSANARGFGGTTDRAEVAGAENDDYDACTVFGTVPTAPADFTATANTAGEGSIDLAWTATALGGSFSRYEIERLDPDGSTWRTIAHETTEATVAYVDETARRGTQEEYRIRVKHTNGTRSLPSTSDTATLTKSGSYLIFPESSTLSRSVDMWHDSITFAAAQEQTITHRYGSDFPTVTEYPRPRGEVISCTVNLSGGTDGVASQAAWTRTVKEDTTYAVLVNGYGERWIVALTFGEGTFVMPDLSRISFAATEITDVPIVVSS